jgi:ATP-dependent exoDNAse (exonuclease V) beta subunit
VQRDLARLPKPGAAVEGVEVAHESQFGETIAAMIATDRTRNPGRTWRSYAVIGRSRADLDRVAAALNIEDIPARVSDQRSGREDRGVQDVLKWTELLTSPGATWAAFWALTRPPVGVATERAHEWLIAFKSASSRHVAGEALRRDPGTFIDWLRERHADDAGVKRFWNCTPRHEGKHRERPLPTRCLRSFDSSA